MLMFQINNNFFFNQQQKAPDRKTLVNVSLLWQYEDMTGGPEGE